MPQSSAKRVEMTKVRILSVLAAAVAMAATPAAAQVTGSDGEAFLAAMKEGGGGKALELVEKAGSTVVNYRGSDGNAGLHIAMRNRKGDWVGFLLARDADPDLTDKNGDTPLIIAARMGYSEGAARMLMARAQVDKTNRLGETALIVAVQQRQPAIVKILLQAGADPDKADYASGYTARDYARRDNRSTDLLRMIETATAQKKSVKGPVRP